jgi:CO dehydrogenase/acetyl-CoA synthase delta subunit
VPRISGELGFTDHLGACKARWAIGRMDYIVPPGLYAIGAPTPESPVIVTANYKMTYDIMRQTLAGRSLWLLVLETYGINVWCAAGKGTFGTGEVVRRVTATRLAHLVNHRKLILPILGAPGVAAHEVAKRCGFAVSYAAIRAADLPEYLDNGMITTSAMRQLKFSMYDRLVLIPVEVVLELKSLAIISCIVLLACSAAGRLADGIVAFGAYFGAVLSGTVMGPLLLPWLPSKSFVLKGATIGLLWTLCVYVLSGASWTFPELLAALLILPAVSAFYTLNFTGCTTFTSRSGVKKEMRIGLPGMGIAIVAGIILLVYSAFM